MQLRRTLLLALLLGPALTAGDPDRGRLVLQNQGCLECHTVNFLGSGHESVLPSPDLAGRLATTYTPSALASAMWNHTPRMWAALSQTGLVLPDAIESEWRDLFAYLYSLQFFELPPEVRRGKAVLDSKCGGCHAEAGSAPEPARWSRVDDPVTLVYQMWKHAPEMFRRGLAQGKEWQRLSGRDVLDLTAYLQNLRNEAPNRQLTLPDASEGRAPFTQHCARCHAGARALETRLRNKTWMDIGAGMWNHAPDMRGVTEVPFEDMRKILAFVWELQYQGAPGNVEQGRRTFNSKRCIACHRNPATGEAGSPRPGHVFTPFSMVALGWGKSRVMHQSMEAGNIRWPSLSAHEMNNLVAFLNSISR